MKYSFNIILLLSILFALSCSKDKLPVETGPQLLGKWKDENDITVHYQNGNVALLISYIEFKEGQLYETWAEPPFYVPFSHSPSRDGSWEWDKTENRIKLFNTPGDIYQQVEFLYYWQIVELTETKLSVNVVDQNGEFIRDRVFIRI